MKPSIIILLAAQVMELSTCLLSYVGGSTTDKQLWEAVRKIATTLVEAEDTIG